MNEHHARGEMAKEWDGWIVDVDVHLQPDSTPPFYLETYLPLDSDGDIVFQDHDRPGFLINFNLRDPENTGYLFPDDPDEAMFSAKGERTCPKSGQWPQFTGYQVMPGNSTLVVKNLNEHDKGGKFSYTLRLLNQEGREWLLDPGGNNQNGYSSK